MSTLWFCISDGLSGLRRSKLSGFVTIVTVSIAIFLVGVFYIAGENFMTLARELKSRVVLEAFVDSRAPAEDLRQLRQRMHTLSFVDSVKYVSKEEALQRFRETFGGEYAQLIDENPLPASYQIYLKPAYLNSDSAQMVADEILRFGGIEDVIYRGRILHTINRYFRSLLTVFMASAVGLSLAGFILVANNIRLTIAAKRMIIETMQLVGATRSLVRGPFFVQGVLEGLFGSLLGLAFISAAIFIGKLYLGPVLIVPRHFYLLMLLLGTVYGALGSLYAVRGRV